MARTSIRNAMDTLAIEENGMDTTPDYVVVGVDIGFTCTGVAVYSYNFPKPLVIQKWPGSDSIVNKVPTAIAYRAGKFRPLSWGLECPVPGEIGRGICVTRLFKFFLDENVLQKTFERNPNDSPGEIDDVRVWYRDFLIKLREHILAQLKARWQVDSELTEVKYIFSLPTAWKEKDTLIKTFKEILKQAGFEGDKNKNSSVTIGLTEAEASAVYSAVSRRHEYKEGDILLVCDAGGGTTDVSVLKVDRTEGKVVEMELLDTPQVLFVGSVQIDQAFEKKVEEDLTAIRREHPELSRHVAQQMARGDFQAIKWDFGKKLVAPIAKLPVPGLPNNSHVRVSLSRDEIKAMFDEQLVKIFELIDMQLVHLRQEQSGLKVSYIVLSGGLGSSKYVQDEFEARYVDMKVLFDQDPKEPPLAVCKGLVLDHIQRICHGTSVLCKRRCRASFGILCNERYDRNRHHGQTPVKSPLDGKQYVTNQIDWFIRKNEVIAEGVPITRRSSRMIGLDSPIRGWRDTIVMSRLPPNYLPPVLGLGDAREVCTIVSNLGPETAGIEMRRKWVILGRKFLKPEYELLVFIEGESLKFRTRMNGEEKSETEAVEAPWIFTRDAEGDEFQGGLLRNE